MSHLSLLLDENLSPLVANGLREAGFDATHAYDVDLNQTRDEVIYARAQEQGRVVVTEDHDFGELLAESGADRPSVVRLDTRRYLRAARKTELLVEVLADHADDLEAGAIVTVYLGRVRVTRLPLER